MGKTFSSDLLNIARLRTSVQHDSLIRFDDATVKPLPITEKNLKPYLEDDSFNYEVAKTVNGWLDSVQNWFHNLFKRMFEWFFGVEHAKGYLDIFLKPLLYLLLGVFLFLIIRFFVKANIRSLIHTKQNPNKVSLSVEEQVIKTEDIQKRIKEALADKDYRLAIRYHYLFILKLLTDQGLIQWESQKTNDDYCEELPEDDLKKKFSRATLLYDYIWYGEFNIDEKRFFLVEDVFDSLKKSITTNG